MIEHGQRRFNASRSGNVRLVGPAKHEYGYAETARRDKLSVGGRAATVLADDRVDAMRLKQFELTGFVERSTAENVDGIGNGERRLDRIDAADEVEMPGRILEGGDLLSSERKEDPARCLAERPRRVFGIRYRQPAIPLGRTPGLAIEPQHRHAGHGRRTGGIRGYPRGVGMCGIDEQGDTLVAQIGRDALRAAETATADGNGLGGRLQGPAGKGKGHCKIVAHGKPAGQFPGFGGAAEDQNAMGHHAF